MHFVSTTLGILRILPEKSLIRIEKYIAGIVNNNSSKRISWYCCGKVELCPKLKNEYFNSISLSSKPDELLLFPCSWKK